ncbi:MAG: ribose-phosphate diphosphokinase [Armatimonadota bacterium]
MSSRPPMAIFSGTAHPELSTAIASHLGIPLGGLKITRFPDSEIYVKFEESVRGADAFLIQPTCAPIDANLLELLILIDALKRASARRITAVLPYYGYARQEKKDRPREPITAKLIADLLRTAGIDHVVAMDLHADAIQGFFDGPVDHLTAIPILSDYLAARNLDDICLVSPDEGRVKTIRKIASRLRAPLAVGYKFHPAHGVSEISGLAGDVRGKTCIVYDDIISTGGSINEIVDTLLAHGARPEITIACTHAVFAGKAVERLSRPEIKEVVVTDTIPLPDAKRIPKITVLSAAGLFAEAIQRIWTDSSVSSLFD